jgi:hypothetical protein
MSFRNISSIIYQRSDHYSYAVIMAPIISVKTTNSKNMYTLSNSIYVADQQYYLIKFDIQIRINLNYDNTFLIDSISVVNTTILSYNSPISFIE